MNRNLNSSVAIRVICGFLVCISSLLNQTQTPTCSAAEAPITDDDRDHWSFRPLKRPAIPRIQGNDPIIGNWPRNSIDQFIMDRLLSAGLTPMPAADRVTLIRRLSFDLIGLPPTPDEVDAFVSDESADAYEKLVDRLLASPAYGERWAQHWLDLARFAETDGFEHDKVRPESWKYRDWVIDALNEDLPFDTFVQRQLAGDEIAPEFRVATGFLTCGPDMPDINLQDERRHSFLNDMASTVGSVFLGLQVGCAQCHDHKYDPVSQLDFYRLRAFFDPAFPVLTKNKTVPLPELNNQSTVSRLMIRGDFRRKGAEVEPAFLRIVNPSGTVPQVQDGRRNLRSEFANWLMQPNHPLTTRTLANRLWQYHFGIGLNGTPSDMGITGDEPDHLKLVDWLATEIPRRGWSLKQMHRLIVNSATWRQISRLPDAADSELALMWRQAHKLDSENRLHSRGTRRRLEGEAIRDAMLSASGQLSQRRGGPGIRPPLPPELVQTLLRNQWPVSKDPADYTRRSLYLFVRRNLRYPIFEAFDKPDTNASCPRRNESTIAPQALMLLNSELSFDVAGHLADRIVREVGSEHRRQIDAVYRHALSRRPTVSEIETGTSFLKRMFNHHESESRNSDRIPESDAAAARQVAALTDYCLAVMNLNEFIYVD